MINDYKYDKKEYQSIEKDNIKIAIKKNIKESNSKRNDQIKKRVKFELENFIF